MSAERDVNRIVRSWIREDEHDSADAILGIVLSRLDTTPQRRSWWPARRFPNLNRFILTAGAAAAALVVVVVGYNLLPGTGFGSKPTLAPTATLLPTVPAPNADVTVGTPFEATVQVTLPTNWAALTMEPGQFDFGRSGSTYPYLGFFLVDGVYIDPCHPEQGLRPDQFLGPLDDDEVVDGLTTLEGFNAGEITTVNVGGQPARHFVVSNSIDTETANCTNGLLLPLFVMRGGEDVSTNGGTTQEVWVLGFVGDERHLVIIAELGPDPGDGDQALIEAIVRTVRW